MNDHPETNRESIHHHLPVWLTWLIRLLVAAVLIALGLKLYFHLLATAPKHERKPQGEREVVVEVAALRPVSQPVSIATTGTVVSARELSLMPQVSGRVVGVHPALEPGGLIPAGTVVVTLEKADYELAVQRAQATLDEKRNALADARTALQVARNDVIAAESDVTDSEATVVKAAASYQIELGEQDVARHAWEMVEDRATASELDRELALRQPYLRQAEATVSSAKASVASAKAKLETAKAGVTSATTSVNTAEVAIRDAEAALAQARLELARTEVSVPFDAVVTERAVSVGTQVSTATTLAELVDRSAFWVEVSIPYDRLKWIRLPKDGSKGASAKVRIGGSMADAATWDGDVARCLPAIEESGRQVRLLVRVPDPLKQTSTPLLMSTFVNLDIAGPVLENVFAIPRRCLHNGNEVWLRNPEGRLEIRQIEQVWGDEKLVVVRDGLAAGEELVSSDISSPVSGLKLALPATVAKPTDAPSGDR